MSEMTTSNESKTARHIFVASWFFPPNSSSEGFVTWKLLRNSAHEYDVVCSTSHKWGYSGTMQVSEPNINIHPVETDDLRVWVSKAIEMFEALYIERKYDAVMTRSMPPEAVEVGREIKRRHPEVKWIASFGDPIANNPYSMAGIEGNDTLPQQDVSGFLEDMALTCDRWRRDWREYPDASIRYEAGMRVLQDTALDDADMILCPVQEQMEYMISGRAQKKPFFDLLRDNISNFKSFMASQSEIFFKACGFYLDDLTVNDVQSILDDDKYGFAGTFTDESRFS